VDAYIFFPCDDFGRSKRYKNEMKKILYTIFPSLIPKYWRTKNEDYIIYTWDEEDELFIGANGVQLSLGYVIKNLEPYYKNKICK
jgi:hypothetical protein